MLQDLLVAAVVLLVAAAVLFLAARAIAVRAPRHVSVLLAGAVAVFIGVFGMLAHGKLVMAQWLPVSSVVVLGNWMAPALALMAGVVAGQQPIARWRRGAVVLLLLGLAGYVAAAPLLGSRVAAKDRWTSDGVCLQSCEASCSPASAATLLARHGIAASETEMIALCLTHEKGTPSLGVYRGLKLKTERTPWGVEVVRGSVDELLQTGSPALLRVRLDDGDQPPIAPWAWSSGIGHAVVCLGVRPDGRIEIADPAVGRVLWTRAELQTRWRGEGLRLVRVQP